MLISPNAASPTIYRFGRNQQCGMTTHIQEKSIASIGKNVALTRFELSDYVSQDHIFSSAFKVEGGVCSVFYNSLSL